MLTARQFVAFRLYHVEGWTYHNIGGALSCTKQAAHQLVTVAKRRIAETYRPNDVDLAIHMRALLRPAPVATVHRDLGKAHRRRERLLDELELLMQHRASDLDAVDECMSGTAFLPVSPKRNRHDQWESRYLNGCATVVERIQDDNLPQGFHMEPRRKASIPLSAYYASRAARYCAGDCTSCGIGCYVEKAR